MRKIRSFSVASDEDTFSLCYENLIRIQDQEVAALLRGIEITFLPTMAVLTV